VSQRTLHVLIVARWYPSHDQPGRGTFVGDLAAALRATGRVDVTVASFEATHVRGVAATRAERAASAATILSRAVRGAPALNRPMAWGVTGIPVARLPVILDGERRRPTQIVDAHAEPLLAFSRGLAERQPIDVIHAHTGLPDGAAALRVADELDLPLLVTEHSSTTADELVDAEARELYRRLLAPPRRVVAVSRVLAHDVARALGVSEKALAVLPNAVPVDEFRPGAVADRDANELLYVGARKASKGIETLLRAFAAVRARRPAVRLRMIGSPGQPADEAHWRVRVDELGIRDAVAFEPAASREGVAAAMRRATLFVHPSPHETFGMVAAEALASGLPVAATPSGGVEEIVGRDGRFGAIALSSTAPALADAIERALAAAPRVDRAAMRAHVEANYAAPAVAKLALDAYDGVMVQTRTRPRSVAITGSSPTGAGPVDVGAVDEKAGGFRLPLLLALARGQAIDRVALLPEALRDRLTIVTSPRGRYADDRDLPLWSDWLEFRADRFYDEAVAELAKLARQSSGLGRLRAALGGPNLERMQRDLGARKEEIERVGTQRFFEDAIGRIPAVRPNGAAGGRGGAQWIVALDADDIVLAERLGPTVGLVAPGGLRWLADAWDAAGRPG
jgi:glycosyltransferase involved in cell wall biosynthesis